MGLISKSIPTIVANPASSRNQQARLLVSLVVRRWRFIIGSSGPRTNDWVRDEPTITVRWRAALRAA